MNAPAASLIEQLPDGHQARAQWYVNLCTERGGWTDEDAETLQYAADPNWVLERLQDPKPIGAWEDVLLRAFAAVSTGGAPGTDRQVAANQLEAAVSRRHRLISHVGTHILTPWDLTLEVLKERDTPTSNEAYKRALNIPRGQSRVDLLERWKDANDGKSTPAEWGAITMFARLDDVDLDDPHTARSLEVEATLGNALKVPWADVLDKNAMQVLGNHTG